MFAVIETSHSVKPSIVQWLFNVVGRATAKGYLPRSEGEFLGLLPNYTVSGGVGRSL